MINLLKILPIKAAVLPRHNFINLLSLMKTFNSPVHHLSMAVSRAQPAIRETYREILLEGQVGNLGFGLQKETIFQSLTNIARGKEEDHW